MPKTSQDAEKELVAAMIKRTGGRLKSPGVTIFGDRIVVHGHADSYHAIQLACAGLLESLRQLDVDRPEQIELNVEVIPSAAVCGGKSLT